MEAALAAGVSATPPDRSAFTRADVILCGVLFAGTVLYFVELPRSLGFTDEGLYLYEAKRLLDGDVFYRDIFEIITPGSHYLMAALFWIFGTTITTAKAAAAAIHGVTATVTYLAGRTLGLRRPIAALPAVAYAALCPPAWPYASPHWTSTAVTMILLVLVLRRSWVGRPARALTLGVLSGVLIAVMQQKGVIMAAGVAVVLVKHHVIDRHYGGRPPLRVVGAQLGYLTAGVLLVIVPLFAVLTARAGFGPIVRALIEHPLTHYKTVNQASWGHVQFMTSGLAEFTVPSLLRYLPAALALALVRVLWDWITRTNPEEVRGLVTLIVFGIFSALSIAYLPDFIHVSFIAPVFFVAAAEGLDWALTALEGRSRAGGVLRAAVVLTLLGALAFQLQRNFMRMRAMYSTPADTAFGRIDFPGPKEVEFIAATDELLGDRPAREIFSYPVYPALYLTTGTRNPTPYQILIRRYNFADQFDHTIEILETRQVPVVFVFKPFVRDDDPILRYVRDHYVAVDEHPGFWRRVTARE